MAATATLEFNPLETIDRDIPDSYDAPNSLGLLESPTEALIRFTEAASELQAGDPQAAAVVLGTAENLENAIGNSLPSPVAVAEVARTPEARTPEARGADVGVSGVAAALTTQSEATEPSPLAASSTSAALDGVAAAGVAASGGVSPEISQNKPFNLALDIFKNNSTNAATVATTTMTSARRAISEIYEKIWNVEQQIKTQEKAVSDQCVVVSQYEAQVKNERKGLKEATKDLIDLQGQLSDLNRDLDEAIDESSRSAAISQSMAVTSGPMQQAMTAIASTEKIWAAGNAALNASLSQPPARTTRTVTDPDPAITTDLWVLKNKAWAGGATNAQIEKLNGEDVRTIANLEEYIRMGNLVPGRVKGIGQQAVDKISDALMAWRAKNPIPQPREVEIAVEGPEDVQESIANLDAAAAARNENQSPSLADQPITIVSQTDVTTESIDLAPVVAALSDAAPDITPAPAATVEPDVANATDTPDELDTQISQAYVAGCEAKVSDKPVGTNPHEKGTQLWVAWDQGWQEA